MNLSAPGTDSSAPHAPVPPRAVPGPDHILELEPGEVWWRSSRLRVRVLRTRPEISQFYGGDWLWIDCEYDNGGKGQELVSTAAIARQI